MLNHAMHDLTPQPTFFDEPILPGLDARSDFLTATEELEYARLIDDADLEPFQFHGWLGKRMVRSFGFKYDFARSRLDRVDAIPEALLPLLSRAAALFGMDPAEITQAQFLRYDQGAGIGWHKDRDLFDEVLGISLNTSTRLRFRQRLANGFRRQELFAEPRSIYRMRGEVRHEWEHSVPALETTRRAIIFRTLSAKGRAAAA